MKAFLTLIISLFTLTTVAQAGILCDAKLPTGKARVGIGGAQTFGSGEGKPILINGKQPLAILIGYHSYLNDKQMTCTDIAHCSYEASEQWQGIQKMQIDLTKKTLIIAYRDLPKPVKVKLTNCTKNIQSE